MNSLEDAVAMRGFLDRFQYKEGWSFAVIERNGHYQLQIRAKAPNSNGDGRELRIAHHRNLPMMMNDEARAYFVRSVIQYLEIHEMDEFIKVDGEKPFDPHDDKKKVYL